MKVIVFGLGSMGKRRIRCLKKLGDHSITGYDPSEDRSKEAKEKYGLDIFNGDLKEGMKDFEAAIISVPPDVHHPYMELCLENDIPYFVEASVVNENSGIEKLILKGKKKNVLQAPSATLMFHPAIQKINEIVHSGKYGKLSNVMLYSGQYLPDWHSYEAVSDFYVSNPATGGGREIVPFEMTWFTKVFGMPKRVAGNFRKTINIKGAEDIDDTYNLLLDYNDYLATVTVDVVSRYASRRMIINTDTHQIRWDWDENCVNIYDGEKGKWEKVEYTLEAAEEGYNTNISEQMYVDEVNNFLSAIDGSVEYINSLEYDLKVLNLLYDSETSDKTSSIVRV